MTLLGGNVHIKYSTVNDSALFCLIKLALNLSGSQQCFPKECITKPNNSYFSVFLIVYIRVYTTPVCGIRHGSMMALSL